MPNKMLIDASHPEETRVVVVRGNRVEEFDFEAANRRQLRGNIYLAKVTRVEPSLQACFVDYGGNRHGFLAFSEIHPDYYQIPVADRQALIEEEERAAREAEERRAARHQARHARRDQTISEPAQDGENGGDAATAAETQQDHEHAGEHPDEHSQIEEVPHDDEAPEEIGAHADEHNEHEFAPHSETEFAPPAQEFASASYNEAAGNESGGAAEASETMGENDVSLENGEEQAREARQEQVEDESVEQVGGGALEEVPERQPRRFRRYKIQEVIKRRQVLLVQVVKEERGTKGAALTTYLSLAGRYSVLMPNTSRGGGISRKITSSQDRQRLKELVGDLEVPEGMGVILRTAGASRTKPEIKRDFEYLLRLWETVRELTLQSQAPALVYEEGSLTKRAIRDLYNKDTEEVIVAGSDGYKEAREFMGMLMPSHEQSVIEYKEKQPIFARYGVEHQLDAMFSPTVQLKSGGYIVINPTEALVSIDVNSGRSTREHHIEDTALKTNLEAAEEIARQLRLRDLAGLIVIDFIDMEEKRNNRHVERKLKDALRHDRARIQVGRISHFGLMEMSRQRIRTGVLESSSEICPVCGGTGHVRAVSSVALQLLRGIEDQLMKSASHDIVVRAKTEVAIYVLNHKRAHLRALEEQFGVAISIQADSTLIGQQSFAIERGGIARQKPAVAAPRISPDSVAVEIDESEEYEESAAPLSSENDDEGETRDGEAHDDHGGSRRGRRRRGRRGRGGGHREQSPTQHAEGSEEAPAEHSQNGFDAQDEHEAQDTHREAHHEAHGDGRNGENGEPRKRRRRGRRGGRRNRGERDRNREGAPSHEFEAHQSGSDFEAEGMPEQNGAASFETPSPVGEAAPAPASEPAPANPPAPAKRRSTVREAAPIVNFDDAPASETPKPAPAHEEPGETSGRGGGDIEAEPEQPRRSGWWSRLRGK